MDWLLFLSQLPANPSSLRVNVWRKLRAAGALGLQNGVWVMPKLPEQAKFLEDLLSNIRSQDANGQIFTVTAMSKEIEMDILSRFSSDRDEEYAEFEERSLAFMAEINKETNNQKFTFAELEENEQDFQRLTKWLEKIQKRDFMSGESARKAEEIFELCRSALEAFSTKVYIHQLSGDTPFSSTADESIK